MPKTTTSNMKDGAAFDARNVTPFFQHIVSVAADRKKKNEGIEILARIKAGDQYLTPASFIGTSCTSKLLNRLTSILLYKTLLHIKKTSNRPRFISFNVCANQLHVSIRNKLIKALTSLHEEFKAIGVDLVMEITEDERLEKVEKVIETLKIINHTGIKIAIDDYGRYFSSPSMVSFIEDLHILKVDKSFISSLEANCLISKSFIKHALDIAEIKKCQIIIEGIEKGSQIKLLGSTANHSTIWYQGYFFSQPKPICEL